jgi:hypothetical protein
MKSPNEPLEYPAHYLSTDRWKKFFIGIRGLGPDLSFFRGLKEQQAARSADCMLAWSTDQELKIASIFGFVFQQYLRWETPFFLPEDRLNAIIGGPEFRSLDCGEVEDALAEFEERLSKRLPKDFWQNTKAATLGQLVSEVTVAKID